MRWIFLSALMLLAIAPQASQAADFHLGVDPSMLPELEKAGAIYRADGKPADAIATMAANGVNLFRIRLFVKPTTDFKKNWGAVQDLPEMLALAKRIKATGAKLLLDIHYSDTWADPEHQTTPEEWKDLDVDQLEQRVHDYTAQALKAFADQGTMPDLVQVGNEITSGMLWPTGKVLGAKGDAKATQWRNLSRYLNAGAKACREAQTPAHPIRIVLHIHGGGRPGIANYFFSNLAANPVDFDVIALSFYPAWADSIDELRKTMTDMAAKYDKDILLAEVSYSWTPMRGLKDDKQMRWAQTREGQTQFLQDLTKLCREVPKGHGIGFVWWYPEAVPIKGQSVWRNGAEALFDEQGNVLPALASFRTLLSEKAK